MMYLTEDKYLDNSFQVPEQKLEWQGSMYKHLEATETLLANIASPFMDVYRQYILILADLHSILVCCKYLYGELYTVIGPLLYKLPIYRRGLRCILGLNQSLSFVWNMFKPIQYIITVYDPAVKMFDLNPRWWVHGSILQTSQIIKHYCSLGIGQ